VPKPQRKEDLFLPMHECRGFYRSHSDDEDVVELSSIDVSLMVKDIYFKVYLELEENDARNDARSFTT
jgi:hypothetical protein